ncbi:MAG: hypothetical protein WBH68_02670 [Erysipelotrichaceae bacterium]|jgi:hypothetical protein
MKDLKTLLQEIGITIPEDKSTAFMAAFSFAILNKFSIALTTDLHLQISYN